MTTYLSDMINSKPITVGENKSNPVGIYVYNTNNTENTTCLEIVLRGAGGNLGNFLTKIGEFNFKASSNPRYTPPYYVPYKDYVETCPENWVDVGYGQCNSPESYNGGCNGGKVKCRKELQNRGKMKTVTYNEVENYQVTTPASTFTNYNNAQKLDWGRSCNASWKLKDCPDGWSRYVIYGTWVTPGSGRPAVKENIPVPGGRKAYVFYEAPFTKIVLDNNQQTGDGWYYTGSPDNFDATKLNTYNRAPNRYYNLRDIGVNLCKSFPGYNLRCADVSGFGGYSDQDKFNWANYCGATWSYRECPVGWTKQEPVYCPRGYSNEQADSLGQCYAGWGWTFQEGDARRECASSNGTWIPKDYRYNAYTCKMPNTENNKRTPVGGCCGPASYRGPCNSCNQKTEQRVVQKTRQEPEPELVDVCVRDPSSSFRGYSVPQKQSWESQCQAFWPTKQRLVPGVWKCDYGRSIQQDVNEGKVFELGNAADEIQAVRIILENRRVAKPRYFAVAGNKVYIANDGSLDVFSSKGNFQNNCDQAGPKVVVYQLQDIFFAKIEECKRLNDNINSVNNTLENFENMIETRSNKGLWLLVIFVIFVICLFFFNRKIKFRLK